MNKTLRILHCANFNHVRLKGCYLASFGYKLNNGLIRLGHQVLTYSDRDMARLFGIFGNKCLLSTKKSNENFLKFALNIKPDIIILGHADTIKAETLAEIKKNLPEIKIIQWNVDSINPKIETGRRNIEHIKSKLDVVDYTFITTMEKTLYQPFLPQKNKINFIPNPTDHSIETGRSFENINPLYDIFFAASPDSIRDLAGKLITAKEITEILQQNCPNSKMMLPCLNAPAANGTQYLNLLSHSAMVLNLSRISDEYLYSSDRMAHAIGNGCLTFIDKRTGYADIFKEDELVFYTSAEELFDKINYFKQNQEKRQKIAKKGWQRYYDLFNEQKVASYMLSELENKEISSYPF